MEVYVQCGQVGGYGVGVVVGKGGVVEGGWCGWVYCVVYWFVCVLCGQVDDGLVVGIELVVGVIEVGLLVDCQVEDVVVEVVQCFQQWGWGVQVDVMQVGDYVGF